ncbi:hypothetical protein BJ138DRAFT_1157632 [Hygrophoropsis aurantiaca]|uniref:Uncharacterized protein n=1 Tax=Hygrophoropsis aurantiaca TaxID=72124 RepID=A0ACB8A5S7_9AGAM|nr:hypothetical protein BJ138DRAFT_1157632 [Hygrophoropsis aurantiaca]
MFFDIKNILTVTLLGALTAHAASVLHPNNIDIVERANTRCTLASDASTRFTLQIFSGANCSAPESQINHWSASLKKNQHSPCLPEYGGLTGMDIRSAVLTGKGYGFTFYESEDCTLLATHDGSELFCSLSCDKRNKN